MPGKIKLSAIAYDEISVALAKQGQKINEQGALVIEKDSTFEYPYDLRLATIRRDCLIEAVKLITARPTECMQLDVIDTTAAMYQFVLTGDKEVSKDD